MGCQRVKGTTHQVVSDSSDEENSRFTSQRSGSQLYNMSDTSAGGSLPEYKDLSPIQFVIGFMGCIQEEQSNTVCNNMLEYGHHLLQDTLEANWLTARHAHMVLLQDMERGKVTWRRPDAVEKIRIRNTARVIPDKSNPEC